MIVTTYRYLQNATNDENYTANNPAARIVRSVVTRGWVDNGNYIVDCDLRNPALQDNRATGGDQCAALTGDNVNFGNANPNSTVINPAILKGWGVRPGDWQLGVSVQHEVLPRTSVEVGFFHRSFYGFTVTDNLAVNLTGRYINAKHGFTGDDFVNFFPPSPEVLQETQRNHQLFTRGEAVWSLFDNRFKNFFGVN